MSTKIYKMMKTFTKLTFALAFFIVAFVSLSVQGQTDSLTFHNGNYIVGEVKNMDRGVLTIETDFSDKDFTIEWDGISEIFTDTYFLITLSNGDRYNGYINSSEPGKITITTDDGQTVEIIHDDIVWLEDVDKGFWSKLYFSFDVGFDLTKANNFSQVTARSTIGYLEERWNLDAYFNTLFSAQDNTEDIKRTDGGVGYKYFLPRDWYPLVSVDFLSNTEQKLDLRSTARLGVGKYAIHTNRTYWGFAGGANFNNEKFSVDSIGNRKSWEGFIGTELNMFDIGDLSLFTKIYAFPSFTESGRWRTDFNFDAKYEMPFDDDFYIKLGLTFNFDNQPVEGASEIDYVFYTGFGWSW